MSRSGTRGGGGDGGRRDEPAGDGAAAWERLTAWRPGRRYAGRGRDEGALAALDDVGLLRRLLDRAELAAVRSARGDGRSWAEIATCLGVTRQSAWERWRDVDETPASADEPVVTKAHGDTSGGVVGQVVGEAADQIASQARRSRRNSTVRVPSVVGLSWSQARARLLSDGLVAVGWDPDAVPLTASAWPHAAVTDQSPESGAKVPPGTHVRLWLDFGGGSAGVREPRRPGPDPLSARAARDELSGEAVG